MKYTALAFASAVFIMTISRQLKRFDVWRRIPSTIRSNAQCYGGRVLLERGDVTNAVKHLRAAAFLGSEEATNRLKALRLRSR